MIEFFTDMRRWLSDIFSFLRTANLALKKAWEWTLNHVYALVPVLVATMKSVWDFIKTAINEVQQTLSAVDPSSVSGSGLFSSGSEVFAFCNTILPLDELFAWIAFLLALLAASALVKLLFWIKRLILF